MMSENLSSANLSAANLRRNGLYLALVVDMCLDVKAMGCCFCTTVPSGFVCANHCANIPVNPSLHLSVMTMNGVLSHFGPCKIGSEVIAILRSRNTCMCTLVYHSSSLCVLMVCQYVVFMHGWGRATVAGRSCSGPLILAYPLMRSWK
jgi:hypothetical protein